jgi:hypothetical protein
LVEGSARREDERKNFPVKFSQGRSGKFCFNERTVENFLQASPDPEMGHSGGVDPPVWKLHIHYGILA